MHLNRKGFEMGANIIVVLIISIVIFIGGVAFTMKFFGLAEERKAAVDTETQAAIENLLDTGAKVAIPLFKKEVKRGQGVTFGIGIRSISAKSENFHVRMSFDEASDHLGNPLPQASREYINSQWISTDVASEIIRNQERKVIPIYIKAKGALCDSDKPNCEDSSTQKGTYIFNVCVCNEKSDGENPCFDTTTNKDKECILLDPADPAAGGISKFDLYGKTDMGDIHKILVEVT